MHWSNEGFEAETLASLVERVASWHVSQDAAFEDSEFLVCHSVVGERYANKRELRSFNKRVVAKIEVLEDECHQGRSYSQKHDDYMSDCADWNWKERT